MTNPQASGTESQRLHSLRSLSVLDTPREERFDRITRLASGWFDVPIAVVALVEREREWFKSRHGLKHTEAPREHSFGGLVVERNEALEVHDASSDPRFANHPLVAGPPHVRFLAGYPLRDVERRPLGALCIADWRPRSLNQVADGRALLALLAKQAQAELLSPTPEFVAYGGLVDLGADVLDADSQLLSEQAFRGTLAEAIVRADRAGLPVSLLAVRGPRTGSDPVEAVELCRRIRGATRSFDPIGLIDGWCMLLLMGCTGHHARDYAGRLGLGDPDLRWSRACREPSTELQLARGGAPAEALMERARRGPFRPQATKTLSSSGFAHGKHEGEENAVNS